MYVCINVLYVIILHDQKNTVNIYSYLTETTEKHIIFVPTTMNTHNIFYVDHFLIISRDMKNHACSAYVELI